jgi:hypothetical protein
MSEAQASPRGALLLERVSPDGMEGQALMQPFDKEHLPDGNWRTYRKTALTRMIRIEEPFMVETSEGILACQDGYLAIDARGYPYPIAADEQALIYEEVQ